MLGVSPSGYVNTNILMPTYSALPLSSPVTWDTFIVLGLFKILKILPAPHLAHFLLKF